MDYASKYAEFLKKHAEIKRPLKVVCDTSNGATSIVLEKLVDIPNIELILINNTPDPEFPAHGPNPLATEATKELCSKVLEIGADFGVAFDADGDRAFFVDNEGKLIPSYVTAAIWFKYSTPPFIADELVYLSLTTSGVIKEKDVAPSQVGAFFIKESMQKNDATLGAEFSGHFYFKEFFGLDSGIFSMIHMTNILSQQDKTLAELCSGLPQQTIVNADLKLHQTTWDKLIETIKEKTSSIAKNIIERNGLTLITEDGWINIRPSNTEPFVRISVGSTTKEIAELNMISIIQIVKDIDA